MRYLASEKLEIIRTVETSPLPVRRTLAQIGIPKSTFYAWLDRHAAGGFDGLEDRKPRPDRVWNRIPDEVRQRIIEFALNEPELSPREIAVAFTDRQRSYVSEASVYRLLQAEGLLTSPAFIVMKAAERFTNPTTAVNQLWQTDFTYLKVTGWGWYSLPTVLYDFSHYIVAFKLCTTMAAADVTATLDLALQASGLDQVEVDRLFGGEIQNSGAPPLRPAVVAAAVSLGRDQRLDQHRFRPPGKVVIGHLDRIANVDDVGNLR